MKIVVVVDANIILAALLGGKPSFILFDSKFHFEKSGYKKLLKTYDFIS